MSGQASQSAVNICLLDITTITPFQKELHFPKENEEENVESVFCYGIQKTSWGTHMPVRMKREETSSKLVYTANPKFDFLLSTTLHQQLPAIVLTEQAKSDGIEICWPHNIGHNIIVKGTLNIDGDDAARLDPHYLDIYSQFMMKDGAGFENKYKTMIGSVPCLEEWNTELPRYSLKVPQPWYYSWDQSWAFPLCKSSKSEIVHEYEVKSKIFDLLRIRRKCSDGTYKRIKPKAKFFKNIKNDNEKFDKPELMARYSVVNPYEKRSHQHDSGDTMYILDIVHTDSTNPHKFGSNVLINLEETQPCLALFWVAENQTAKKIGNMSNYTTDADNIYGGFHPIDTVSMKHGTSVRFDKMPSSHFADDEAWDNFPSAPREAGYFACSFTYDIDRPNINISKSLGEENTKLILHMKNTDPFLDLDEMRDNLPSKEESDDDYEEVLDDGTTESDTAGDKFVVHTIGLIVRKIKFVKDTINKNMGYSKCKIDKQNIVPDDE